MTFLLFPIKRNWLNTIRYLIAIPLGLGLFYHDTWLPSVYSIYLQFNQVSDFSFVYLVELSNRFINWSMILSAFIIWTGYLYINQWVRVTTIVVASMLSLMFLSIKWPHITTKAPTVTSSSTDAIEVKADKPQGTLTAQIQRFMNDFWQNEDKKRSPFSKLSDISPIDFDILFIHVCSFSWSDIYATHTENHPLWKKFDVQFDKFNSAASYSNPAALRLLRGSCGQPKFPSLFEPTAPDCYLLNSMSTLGIQRQWMLNHSGTYGNMLSDLKQNGGLSEVPLMSQANLPVHMQSFYGGEIFSDKAVLNRWVQSLKKTSHSVTFFNTISLHDGNRSLNGNALVPYPNAIKNLLDTVDNLFDKLNNSGKKTLVVFMGAHGRNFAGDAIQMSGLRDIPSPDITRVPVAIKFTGLNKGEDELLRALHIKEPSSFYALSELIARAINLNIFEKENAAKLPALLKNLPVTPMVSENQGASVVNFMKKIYIKLRSDYEWMLLPRHKGKQPLD